MELTASCFEIDRGQVVVEEGHPGDEAFVLVSGAADVFVGGRRVGQIGPGELFGEIAPIDRGLRTATVVATAASCVAVLDREATKELLGYPSVALGVAARLASWLRTAQTTSPAVSAWSRLTVVEQAVARLVGQGLTNRQIGERLFVSAYTVDAHLRHIFAKLGISSRVELATQTAKACSTN